MIRIGLSRWFVRAAQIPRNNGEVTLRLELVPQALRYKVSIATRGVISETEVAPRPFITEETCLRYDLRPIKEVAIWRRMANFAGSFLVHENLRNGLVDWAAIEVGQTIYVVVSSIMRVIETGKIDEDEQIEYLDLIGDMIAMREARQNQLRQLADLERLNGIRNLEARRAAAITAMNLLFSRLNPEELAEAKTTGHVTVKNEMGSFVVPVSTHGLVRQYIGEKKVAEYCLVFLDSSIPAGDEALMKILLLKADPNRFFKTAVVHRFAALPPMPGEMVEQPPVPREPPRAKPRVPKPRKPRARKAKVGV